MVTNDLHFTILGFTAVTGELVMCVNIFSTQEMLLYMKLAIDIRVLAEASITIKEKFCPEKRYPGVPTCKFCGKDAPCFVCCSPKGGITSELLTQMLQRMGVLDLFPWKHGEPIPFFLLDGHHLQFQLPFLKYINDLEHPQKVCIGVPNKIVFWQVGDSPVKNVS